MATEWYLMGSAPVYNSGYEKEEFDMYALDSFHETLETSPVSETIQKINHDLTLISELKAVVLNNVSDSSDKSTERHFLVTIGTLQCGDYISYENKTWLITSFVGNNGIYEKAIATLCTFSIKFQSPSGTILSYPCIDESTSGGVSENQTIAVLESQKRIKLPFCLDTDRIKIDDRFFVDKSNKAVFKVTGVNNTEYSFGDKGLIVLTLKSDVIQLTDGILPKDRPDLGICNYFEPSVTPPIPDPEVPTEIVTITSDASDNQVILGITHTFSTTFKNELGQDVSNVIAQYSVDNTYGGKVVLVDNGDGTATIKAGNFNDNYLCTKQFTLRCYDATHGFESTVLLTIVGIY